MLPLKGITVVSLEQAVAAPFATRQLADYGARVIKVERPITGDFARNYDKTVKGMSSHFVWLNRSKESIALDLKNESHQSSLHDILSNADVFIHNLAPGAVDRLGFGSNLLREVYPRLIICSISGYGNNGSYRDKKAYDLLIQCEAGAVSITGTEETPSKAGISIADIAAGMYAYSGILTALIARGTTGKGSTLEVSMLEALGEWMGYPMYYAGYSGEEPNRTGASHATIYPYGPFEASDQKKVFFGIQNEREWQIFCENILEDSSITSNELFKDNASRLKNKNKLQAIIDTMLQTITSEELTQKLDTYKIANARLNSMQEFMNHPQLLERDRFREIDTPVGPIKALIPPVTSDELSTTMSPIPKVGEHTDKILAEFTLKG